MPLVDDGMYDLYHNKNSRKSLRDLVFAEARAIYKLTFRDLHCNFHGWTFQNREHALIGFLFHRFNCIP